MKAMGYASPAKQRSGGNDMIQDVSGENNRSKNISEEMEPAQERGMKKEVRLIKKKKASTTNTEAAKKETAKKAEKKVLTAKEKALKALKDAQEDNEVSNIEKETSKVKKNSTKKRKQAKRKDSQAERRTEKTKRLEERIERRKARRSPAKQTAKQKANLPKEIVNAIAAKSPAKQRSSKNMTPAEEKALRDKSVFGPDGKNVAKPPKGGSNTKADALFERIVKRSPTKQTAKQKANLRKKDEVSKFEKNVEIAEKFDAKIEKAKGNTKKIARLTKRANRKMDRSAN